MFESLRNASGALQELVRTMEAIRRTLSDHVENGVHAGALSQRVSEIEIGYAKWTAEAEASMLKADALFKNARNSEERARDAKKKSAAVAESGLEGAAEMRRAYEEMYGQGNTLPDVGERSPGQEPPAVHLNARNNRLRSKFQL